VARKGAQNAKFKVAAGGEGAPGNTGSGPSAAEGGPPPHVHSKRMSISSDTSSLFEASTTLNIDTTLRMGCTDRAPASGAASPRRAHAAGVACAAAF